MVARRVGLTMLGLAVFAAIVMGTGAVFGGAAFPPLSAPAAPAFVLGYARALRRRYDDDSPGVADEVLWSLKDAPDVFYLTYLVRR